jgi:hypothetical protein
MLKPTSLREHLTAAVPFLRQNPDKLLVFIDRGSLASTLAPGFSFEYRFTLTLILTDYAGHPDAVMVPLLEWLRRHQPDLLANPGNREQISFEADVLANDKLDLEIKVPLTEGVGVHPRPGGGFDVEHYPEPDFGNELRVAHWEVYFKGEKIGEWYVQE